MQTSIPGAVPADAVIVSSRLAIWKNDEMVVAFSAADPICTVRAGDRDALRMMASVLSSVRLAPDTALAEALGVSRETIRRNRRRLMEAGPSAIRDRRGSKGPTKLTDAVCVRVQRLLDGGMSIRGVAREVGVTDGALHRAFKHGRLTHPDSTKGSEPAGPQEEVVQASNPSERAVEDQTCEMGVATKRVIERVMARFGKLPEALPKFEAAEAVQGAGVLLAVPSLIEQGLIEVGEGVYGSLRNGFFGLKSVLLTFCFMALLRIKTPEQLKTWAPGELGLLLGLDRAPVVETLRRKLKEMKDRGLALTFQKRLTERWAASDGKQLGILYIDGHVRVYNGRKHKLPELHVQKRGRPMPGTQDFHVNDRRADPLFYVTAEATEGLVTMIDKDLLPEVRRLIGPRRRVTIVFDRQGWSPDSFKSWQESGFDILTYRKGKYGPWRKGFRKRTVSVEGRKLTYDLAERRVKLGNGLEVREVRRRAEDGHQTAVITTSTSLSTFQIAYRMFSRWTQENFFRYMRQNFAIDHLATFAVEPANAERMVSNPEREKLYKELKKASESLGRLAVRRGNMKPGEKVRAENRTLTEDEMDELIKQRERKTDQLRSAMEKLPTKVPIGQILDPTEIVRLEPERKQVTDAFKMISYRAETALARVIDPFFKRHQEEARQFLKTVFQDTADLIPDQHNRTLIVRFHGLSNPRTTRALQSLCEVVTESQTCYPGTDLRMRFEALNAT